MSTEQRFGFDLGQLLLQLGEDITREGLLDTPKRIERAWSEFLSGYTLDPEEILKATFEAEGSGIQACTGISFTSMCEHHLLPFFGTVSVVYQPKKVVVGLSKITRLVDCFAKRLQIQERMTEQIAQELMLHVEPKGVLVICKAKHLCCHGRGIRRSEMKFQTTSIQGQVDQSFWELLKC